MLPIIKELRDIGYDLSFLLKVKKVKKRVDKFIEDISEIILEEFVNLPCYYHEIKIAWEINDKGNYIQASFSDYSRRTQRKIINTYSLENIKLISQKKAASNEEIHALNKTERILICVPHCDDEFFLAGGVIKKKLNEGAKVSVVFCFNNDNNGKEAFEIRHEHAINALEVLGVQKDDIYCLGYSNGHFIKNGENIYFARNGRTAVNKEGVNSTYGTKWIEDFHSMNFGEKATFTYENIRNDLIALIKLLMPEEIYAIDLDNHIDHVVSSLLLEEAVGYTVKSCNTYYPKVYKGFAYAMSAYGARDLYKSLCTKPTRRTWRYVYNRIRRGYGLDNPRYLWRNRIRIENPLECRKHWPDENILMRAYLRYGLMYSSIASFVNADTVFWERNTKNIALKAKIDVSSGDGKYLNDFKLLDISDIKGTVFSKECWRPVDEKKCLHLTWEEEKSISIIVIYQNVNFLHGLKKVRIKMEGYENTFKLSGRRYGDKVVLDKSVHSKWMELSFVISVPEYGIDEIEVYEYMEKSKKNNFEEPMIFPWKYERGEVRNGS